MRNIWLSHDQEYAALPLPTAQAAGSSQSLPLHGEDPFSRMLLQRTAARSTAASPLIESLRATW